MEYKDPEEEKEEEVRDAWDSSDEEEIESKTPNSAQSAQSSSNSSKTPSRQATPTQKPMASALGLESKKEDKKNSKKEKEKKKKTEKTKKTPSPPPTEQKQIVVAPSPPKEATPPPVRVPSPDMTPEEAIEELKKLQAAEKRERQLERRKITPESELFTRQALTPSPPPFDTKMETRKMSFDQAKFDPFASLQQQQAPPPLQANNNTSRLIFNGIGTSDNEQHISR